MLLYLCKQLKKLSAILCTSRMMRSYRIYFLGWYLVAGYVILALIPVILNIGLLFVI